MSWRDPFGYYDALSAIRDQMEQWDRITRGSGIDEALAASRRLTEDYARLTKPLIGPSVADEITSAANQTLAAKDLLQQEEIGLASALRPSREMIAVQDLGMLDLSELRTVKENLANQQAAYLDVLERLEALRSPLGSELLVASQTALERQDEFRALLDQAPRIDRFIEDTLLGVEWRHLSETFGSITDLQSTTKTLIDVYHNLYSLSDHALTGRHSLVEGFPPVEVFNHANLLRRLQRRAGAEPVQAPPRRQAPEPLREEVSEEARATLLSLLEDRWPQLLPLWRGARQALDSSNPDRVRHYIVSYREILTHLIHSLAPDEQVLGWEGGKPDDLHDGRPTRRGRLMYISRNIERRNFGAFVVKDVDAALAVLRLFNKGTHALKTDFSARDLIELQIRADNLLLFLLKVAEASDRSAN
jgi:hypothetical protein